jgi:chemotaxis protein histidine kinase CheA
MSESHGTIPEILREAAQIFLTELEGHVAVFRDRAAEYAARQNSLSDTRALAEKFHVIKGGAGFLKLERIREAAAAGEKLFRSYTPDSDTETVVEEFQRLTAILEEETTALRHELT